MFTKNGKRYMEESDEFIRNCCICKHFRMWKPEPEYCTKKKAVVNPLAESEPCFKLRKGLQAIMPGDFAKPKTSSYPWRFVNH
jgi:hypothetical protein